VSAREEPPEEKKLERPGNGGKTQSNFAANKPLTAAESEKTESIDLLLHRQGFRMGPVV